MIELSTASVDPAAASSLASVETPIDVAHLARMTLGDPSLEREVLQLYDRQAGMLLARMQQAPPAAAAAYAHTLKGSSSGIGAWKVARAAEAVEFAANRNAEADVAAAIRHLGTTVGEARAVIAELLRAH
ncbi:MAG TPA: Hpt domain-containing protein [Xanthobacteraceae bacterium]|nr:Hpt domain-containing protein [Xanthobacteraceae bacterium]